MHQCRVLAETGKASERERDLPAHVMVYYAIALALYMGSSTREVLRCLLEGLRWLWGAEAVRVAGKSGISQARTPPGRGAAAPPVRAVGATGRDPRQQGGVVPGVAAGQPGRLLPRRGRHRGEPEPRSGGPGPAAARAPSRNSASWRWSRTARTCCSARAWAAIAEGETTLAHEVLAALRPGMLCLADRQFFGHALWLVLQPELRRSSPFPMAFAGSLLMPAAPARPEVGGLAVRRLGPDQVPEQTAHFRHGERQQVGFEIDRAFFPRPRYSGSRRDRRVPASLA